MLINLLSNYNIDARLLLLSFLLLQYYLKQTMDFVNEIKTDKNSSIEFFIAILVSAVNFP